MAFSLGRSEVSTCSHNPAAISDGRAKTLVGDSQPVQTSSESDFGFRSHDLNESCVLDSSTL
jgi:hypothetical protein